MAFQPPAVRFPLPVEHTQGPPPPSEIWLDLICEAGWCAAGAMTAEILEITAGGADQLIASSDVSCTGDYVRHEFPIEQARPRVAIKAKVRFHCGAEHQDTPLGVIWIEK